MDLKRVLSFPPYPGVYLHPVVYACTAVMLLCLLISIITYIVHHSVIRINRSGWHTLLNFLFHMGLTFGVFAGGINQINLPFVCQIVGIVLHHSSLSAMLWLTFMARNICNDVSRDPLRAPRRNGPAQTCTKPTIISFYLVSDGVPLIIVSVTAAFGLDNYGSRDDALYCWVAWEPSLGSFYAPVALLVFVILVYFLCTYIQLKRHSERKYELKVLIEEEQQFSSIESSHQARTEPMAAPGDSAFAAGVSVLANEHSFKTQLGATAFTLFLFLATWALGALAVSLGHFLDMIFSCLYGAFCVTLGLFLLIQHCAKRDDVWHRWWACCSSKSEGLNGSGQKQEVHQPQVCCHLNAPWSGEQLLSSHHTVQAASNKIPPAPQSPAMSPTGQVPSMNPGTEPSTYPPSLPDEVPCPTLPLQRYFTDRTKSHSFNQPRPYLQDYHSRLTSTSMDGSVHSSHLDSPYSAHRYNSSAPVSTNPLPDLQLRCPSPHLDKLPSCHSLQSQTSWHSVQDPLTSCHNPTYDMQDSMFSCHGVFLPSHGVHTCQWHTYGAPLTDHSSTISCRERSEPLNMPYLQGTGGYANIPKTADKDCLCLEAEQKGFPRNTLPRQHATVGQRSVITRNRSLQEDAPFNSDVGNVWTGPWKNETTV
ncbi:adhesion G protein-coupled receptor A1 [Thalassophryne amazonica]|uniref:adhesion G protein-coupled receptor A1 n=1 Tax=Thalassophryne amazonica TaxID=390379 RepID=UPI001471AFCE|nr:adhesion G protein-coupled receptor A1 [Thalassophryne amazonica]